VSSGSVAGDSTATDGAHDVAARALEEISAARDLHALDDIRARYLGRKDGLLTVHRRNLGKLTDPEAKRQMGQTVNALFERVEAALSERHEALQRDAATQALRAEAIDLTVPPPPLRRGALHPVTRAARDIRRIFGHLGYTTVGGPEIEYDRYNFELVNQPEGHPARDLQDTFYIDDARLLRTHTSPVQIRAMVALGAPLRVIVPGKTYRRDNDPTHSPMFHQVEGLYVDEGVSLADLKGTPAPLPVHRALAGGRRVLHGLRRRRLRHLQGKRLDRDPRLRHGPSRRAPQRRGRPRPLQRLRLRHGHRADRPARLRHRRRPPALRERRPLHPPVVRTPL
jgi:hypothetical protein